MVVLKMNKGGSFFDPLYINALAFSVVALIVNNN